MARTIPTVQGETLTWLEEGGPRHLTVGRPAWFAWLEQASAFAFVGALGTFTARKERKKQGGPIGRPIENGAARCSLPIWASRKL
jgi:hypothetical protein